MMNTVTDSAREAADGNADAINEFRFVLQVHASMRRTLDQALLSTLGVTYTQASALVLLMNRGEVSCHELAKLLGCGTSRISRLIQSLVKRHLVVRGRSRVDRRMLQLFLTVEGAAVADRVPAIVRDAEQSLLCTLPDDERRVLLGLLWRVATESISINPEDIVVEPHARQAC